MNSDSTLTPESATDSTNRSNSRRAPWWLTVLVSVVLACLALVFAGQVFSALASYKEDPPREEAVEQVLRVEVFAVQTADLKRYVWGFGTATADREVVVSAEVSGRVTETDDLEVGKRVNARKITITPEGTSQRTPGDVIVSIDPQTYSERLSQAESALRLDDSKLKRIDTEHATNQRLIEQQKSRLKTIQGEVERLERLFEKGAGRAVDLERTRLEVEQYKETLIRLEQELELYPIQKKELETQRSAHDNDLRLAELELEKASVTPPFSGTLSQVYVEQGQYVRPGDRLVQITDLDHVEVSVPLSLSDASALEKLISSGESPIAELARQENHFNSTDPTLVWKGIVKRIDPIADVQTRTVQVFVEVDNSQQEIPLKPGTFTYARIEANSIPASAGILIPRDAIVDGHVFVVENRNPDSQPDKQNEKEPSPEIQLASQQAVTVIDTYQTFALIQPDIDEGKHIVMTNLDIVTEGSLLDVRTVHTLNEEFQRLRVPYLEQIGE